MRRGPCLKHKLQVYHTCDWLSHSHGRAKKLASVPIGPIHRRQTSSTAYRSPTCCGLGFPLPKAHRPPRSLDIHVVTRGSSLSKRLQHTQARQKEDNEVRPENEVQARGSAPTEHEKDVPEGLREDDDLTFSDKDDANIDILSILTQEDSNTFSQLLHVVGRYLPQATPILVIHEDPTPDEQHQNENADRTISLKAVNKEYGISIIRKITRSDDLHLTIKSYFHDVVKEYTRQLVQKLKADESSVQSIRWFDMHKLREALALAPITLEHNSDHRFDEQAQRLGLHCVQVYSGQEALGSLQTWPSVGISQRLARASADADVIQRAEQAGIDLEAFSTRAIARKPLNEKKKLSYDLPRVTGRSEPRTYDATMSQATLSMMLDTLRDMRKVGLPDRIRMLSLRRDTVYRIPPRQNLAFLEKVSRMLKVGAKTQRISPGLKLIREQRNQLPIRDAQTQYQLLDTIRKNDVVILVSETGSGKTTQLPQLILESAIHEGKGATCNIICTQPRRIAAISVATRVAQERGSFVGGSVGYQVRFDAVPPTQLGSIQYVTAGVLLKRLQGESDEVLSETSHIIVDEVHERDLTIDILLTFLRDLARRRKGRRQPFPKIILMSATMNAIDFENYFSKDVDQKTPLRVASVTVPGRTYPVTPFMLDELMSILANAYGDQKWAAGLLRESKEYLIIEDNFVAEVESLASLQTQSQSDKNNETNVVPQTSLPRDPESDSMMPFGLIAVTIAHILTVYDKGDILVFLPGMKEIDTVASVIQSQLPSRFGIDDTDKIRIHKLHAALHGTNAQVFEQVPEGCRRIILATNIAQTSITLPGVVHVIDSGKRREMAYDQLSRRNSFDVVWIDQATSFQRRGRAGRVQRGFYWAMFTDTRYQMMAPSASPELLISDLTASSLILKSHSDNVDLQEFFARTPDAPDTSIVGACTLELQRLGMLTLREKITHLGQFCSDFPLRPAAARGLLLGLLFGCFRPMLLAACHDPNAPLLHSGQDRRGSYHSALRFAGISDDDRYAFVQAFLAYESATNQRSTQDIAALEQRHIRRDSYLNMLKVAWQLYDTMGDYDIFNDERVVPFCSQDRVNVFQLIDHRADQHAHRINLFKALALSVMDTNLAVWDEEEGAWLAKDIKCILRPYSVNTKQSLVLTQRGVLRQTGELVGYSEMLRNVISSPRPYLVETSCITPLMAMLFGGPLVILDDKTVEIDGWLRYRIQVTPTINQDQQNDVSTQSPALVIAELRKALDRFTTMAFSNLRKHESRRRDITIVRPRWTQLYLNSPLRQTIMDGLVNILDSDAEHWDNSLHKT